MTTFTLDCIGMPAYGLCPARRERTAMILVVALFTALDFGYVLHADPSICCFAGKTKNKLHVFFDFNDPQSAVIEIQ